jgi:hypothetical protein
MSRQVIYNLIDDNGISPVELELLIPINTVFEHEYGTYRVDEIRERDDTIYVDCDRISKYSKLRNFNF